MIELVLSLLKWFLLAFVALLIVGVLFEKCAQLVLEKEFLKNKTFAKVNGKPLHYVKKGEGSCTVIFASGMGSSHAIWKQIQDSVAGKAVTLAYDRNGLMFSDENGLAVTNDNVSRELEILLQATNCPKPYIVVCHSMAGIYLRPFIKRNQDDIKGILFVEAAHPKQIEKASPELLRALTPPPHRLAKLAVNTGIYRALFSFVPISPEIPLQHPLHKIEKDFFYKSVDKTFAELANDRANFKDAEQYSDFGKLPLTVITGTSDIRYAAIKTPAVKNEYRKLVNDVQHDLLNLSANSRMVEAANSGHLIQINDGDLITSEILKYL